MFPSPVLERIGKEAGVRYVDELRDDDLPGEPGTPRHTLLALLQFDYTTMIRSLGGNPRAPRDRRHERRRPPTKPPTRNDVDFLEDYSRIALAEAPAELRQVIDRFPV